MNILKQNSKLKKSGIYNFTLPAFQSRDGFKTCPMAAQCVKGCYARQGMYIWRSVSEAHHRNLDLVLNGPFVFTLDKEIKRRKIKRVRIHDAGDFFDAKYLAKWLAIIELNAQTEFYAYTKMVSLFKSLKSLPVNFKVIFSEGGKEDHLIDQSRDRHSRVFTSEAELLQAGYADASHDDLVALGDNLKIGLVYHGAKSKTWTTNKETQQLKAVA